MSEQAQRPSRPAENNATPVMEPEEVSAREDRAAGTLPAEDQRAVDRSAGEGYVSTQIEAATIPTQRVAGGGQLLTAGGEAISPAIVDLMVVPPIWGGTLTLPEGRAPLAVPGEFRLRLDDGRTTKITIKARAGCIYTVEGSGPLDSRA